MLISLCSIRCNSNCEGLLKRRVSPSIVWTQGIQRLLGEMSCSPHRASYCLLRHIYRSPLSLIDAPPANGGCS